MSEQQKPSVGRIVHFYSRLPEHHSNGVGEGPYPAIVTRVWSESCINLQVFPDCAPPFVYTSVCSHEGGCTRWEFPPRV